MKFLDRLSAELGELWTRLPELATDPHTLIGLVGALLVVAGQRLYHLAVMAPGIAAGAMLGMHLARDEQPLMQAAVVAALCIVAAFALHTAERLAVAAAGVFVAVSLTEALAPLVLKEETPWYVLLGGGVVGLLLFPRLYQKLLVVLTPAIGAFCLGYALDRSTDLLFLAGLTLVGTVFQLAVFNLRSEPEKKPARPKKKAR